MSTDLPIHAVRGAFEAALDEGSVVVSSPTGSGKSTEIPRWIAERRGRVLVIEPRRVACRSLAVRVAELERTRLGDGVGYVVRDESAFGRDTRIVFATPGIVLRAPAMADEFDALVLDELHERSLEIDLLLALFARRAKGPRLVAMSATLDGDRVAAHLGGRHVAAEGRAFPVEIRYLEGAEVMPHAKDLPERVARGIDLVARDPGDILVFLPGKAEIDACARELRGRALEVVPLHGGLSLAEQRRAFEPAARRRAILATNVAETSITLPGVGVVIDSGLARR
ncbi:MAG: DEAD/DEAH box helicase, partial [Polyangiaceae bacterium]|nr:DEAD/DEAH box helicase [Polyangiaceae bacterium]